MITKELTITEARLLYRWNSKESKSLLVRLESLTGELADAGDIIKPELHQLLFNEKISIEQKLDKLWDDQIQLLDHINNEKKMLSKR